jgi:hypothetical protein
MAGVDQGGTDLRQPDVPGCHDLGAFFFVLRHSAAVVCEQVICHLMPQETKVADKFCRTILAPCPRQGSERIGSSQVMRPRSSRRAASQLSRFVQSNCASGNVTGRSSTPEPIGIRASNDKSAETTTPAIG